MKIWKRNAIIASVLLLVCAGVYLNWSKAQKSTAQDLTETLSAEQVMGEDTLVVADGESLPQEAVAASSDETQAADYFAQVRLSRQESRDSAVELLEETIAYDQDGEEGPDHNKRFHVTLYVNSNPFAEGVGRTKKEAEQNAARAALHLMGIGE